MEIYVKNTEQGLIPLYDDDFEEKKKLKIGEVYKVDIKRARNYEFHKKFFALIKIGCENSKSVTMPLDVYRYYVTAKAGYFKTYSTPKGSYVAVDSISFDSMSQDDFEKLYSKVLDFIVKDTQADRDLIERELMTFF